MPYLIKRFDLICTFSLSLSLSLFRLATGSFDQRTKIWTAEGKLLLSISCNASVTGLAYLPQMKVLWVAAGTYFVNSYEPKLGANVSLVCVCVCVCVTLKTWEWPGDEAMCVCYIIFFWCTPINVMQLLCVCLGGGGGGREIVCVLSQPAPRMFVFLIQFWFPCAGL